MRLDRETRSDRANHQSATSHQVTRQVTRLVQRIGEGEEDALDEPMPLVYGELRRIARSFVQHQRPGHTLQPTALVNEAFIKLFQDSEPQFCGPCAFHGAHVEGDAAGPRRPRAHGAAKRGAGEARVPWDINIEVPPDRGSEQVKILDLHPALETLARENASLAQVVEMHYFGGMTAEEAAVATARSVHVVRHDLRLARAWLRRELARL